LANSSFIVVVAVVVVMVHFTMCLAFAFWRKQRQPRTHEQFVCFMTTVDKSGLDWGIGR
jgi:ABC-type glycerol-3-phosphate transport system permease component